MPVRKSQRDNQQSSSKASASPASPSGAETAHFVKGEVVWAKMRFYPPWPAKVMDDFSVKAEAYKKKKPIAPKLRVDFFDNTVGDVHHNQIYKFIPNYRKNGLTNNVKLQVAISQAKGFISEEDKIVIRQIEKEEMLIDSEEEGEEELESLPEPQGAPVEPQEERPQDGDDKKDEREKRRVARASAADDTPPAKNLSGQIDQSPADGQAKDDPIGNVASHDLASQETVIIGVQPNFYEEEPAAPIKEEVADVREEPILSEAPLPDEEVIIEKVVRVKQPEAYQVNEVEMKPEEINGFAKEEIQSAEENEEDPEDGAQLVKQYSKRQPKPTQEYESFKNQQNKRSKKQNEKSLKKAPPKKTSEKMQICPAEAAAPAETRKHQRYSERFRSFDQNDNEADILRSGNLEQRKNTASCEDEKKSSAASKSGRFQTRHPAIEHQHSAEAQSIKSIRGIPNTSLVSQPAAAGISRTACRERVARLKEIKKYFDQFFKDLKELSKEIKQAKIQTLNALGPADPVTLSERFNNSKKKVYRNIQLHHKQIDQYLTLVFKEFNEVFLVHESKLGHALMDMQQFLQQYQSTDENVQGILSKLDMIIHTQKRKIEIEIFGENPINCDYIKEQLNALATKDKAPAFQSPPELAAEHAPAQTEEDMQGKAPQDEDIIHIHDGSLESGHLGKRPHPPHSREFERPSKRPKMEKQEEASCASSNRKKEELSEKQSKLSDHASLTASKRVNSSSSKRMGAQGMLPLIGMQTQNQTEFLSLLQQQQQYHLYQQMMAAKQQQQSKKDMGLMDQFPNMGFYNLLQNYQQNPPQNPRQSVNLTIISGTRIRQTNNGVNYIAMPGFPGKATPSRQKLQKSQSESDRFQPPKGV